MQKTCKKCSTIFEITNSDLDFYKKISPKIGEKIFEVTTPTFCPDCRQQRRLTFRNEGNLYRRVCDATGKNIFSCYSPDKPYIVYDRDFYISDKWEPLDFGIDFDFDKNFSENFDYLLKKVPQQNLSGGFFTENSTYINYAGKVKDCYMSFAIWDDEKVFYSNRTNLSDNCVDTLHCNKLSNSYECYNCNNSYNLKYCINTTNSRNSYFLINCDNSEFCFLSSNLVGKKYFFKNIEYSKDEYEKLVKKFLKENLKFGWQNIDNVKNNAIYKNLIMNNCENSLGDNIEFSKKSYSCFNMVGESENCKFIENGGVGCTDCYDGIGVGENYSLGYEIVDTGVNTSRNISCVSCYNAGKTYYSINCHDSENLFGCVGLRNKKYCIFNKQYSKEEYISLASKIIEHMKITGEWGEFFSADISPFGYNETVAQEYFPLEKEEILKKGFNYSDYEKPEIKVGKIIPAEKLPENINDIPDDILNWAIKCEATGKPFRIIKQELEFYRKHNLPIPIKHPDQRHKERMKLRNPRKLFDRKCNKCRIDMKTTFSEDREEIVYCEECYNKKIY